ncbi:MAG: dienelactone hydrolase family protein [Cyclobacteriaceae bacterium]|nr:dienelactone hydrolase family protein [Cyclobacteriaceae bacterium]
MEDTYQNISFNAQGRYALLGELSANTKSIFFVFHGQGQLAHFFVQKFKLLVKQGYTIIAPEGLHNYYLQGFSGRVGASWMTNENRLVAIENYIHFLDAMYKDVKGAIAPTTKVHLLGFSQGAATASRWVAQSNFDFEQLILWGGTLPPDLNKENILGRMKNKKLIQVVGKKDPYINADKIKELKALVNNYQLSADYKMYEGGHDIEATVLKELF